jgi:translation initiation factor 3 subunit L
VLTPYSPVSISDVDFSVSGDMIHVTDVTPPKRNGEYFLRHIAKQNTLMEDLAPAKPLIFKGNIAAA